MPNLVVDTYKQRLHDELATYKIEVSDRQVELLLKHLALVLDANTKVNLTRITNPESAVTLHIVDSLLFYPYLKASSELTHLPYLDIGTGAGYPGIPLGIVSEQQGLLIDATQKKIAQVQDFIAKLSLGNKLSARALRAEELPKRSKTKYGTVVARAVGNTATLLEYATPLLCKHGSVILSKGKLSEDEYNNGLYAADLCGLKIVSRETIELPHQLGERTLLIYTKESASQIKLPRRPGMAQHHPLHTPKQI